MLFVHFFIDVLAVWWYTVLQFIPFFSLFIVFRYNLTIFKFLFSMILRLWENKHEISHDDSWYFDRRWCVCMGGFFSSNLGSWMDSCPYLQICGNRWSTPLLIAGQFGEGWIHFVGKTLVSVFVDAQFVCASQVKGFVEKRENTNIVSESRDQWPHGTDATAILGAAFRT
jgi:hypothetical protein